MAEAEEFKVTDRRRGREVEAAVHPDVPSGEGTPSAASPRSQDAPPQAERSPASGGAPPIWSEADLRTVFVMFASSALVHLGEAADPVSGERRVDLEQARAAIDLLLLLRDKTRGNLSEEESRLLEDMLYDLQMRFVRATVRR
jgi:Domain of unknown function (DUF1844)